MTSFEARCAAHPDDSSIGPCVRCGTFVCFDCAKLDGDDTYCADCYARAGASAPASTRATTALVLGLLAASGCVPLAIPGVLLGHLELGAIERGESPAGGTNLARGALWVGYVMLGLTAIAVVIGIVLAAVL